MNLNKNDYEIARPGKAPLNLVELRPSMAPGELFAKTESEQEFLINEQTFAAKRDDNPARLRLKAEREPVTTFEIRTGLPDVPKDRWQLIDTFTDLEEAKTKLAALKSFNPDFTYALRKNTELLTTHDPKVWFAERTATGEWERPEWLEKEQWVKDISHEQLLHLSVGQVGNFAYYPTRAAAQNDLCAIESAARYLAKHYGDVLEPDHIAQIVYASDPPGTLQFTGDPDEIAHVYRTSGIGSCMAFNRQNHPTQIYGAGDIQMMTLVRNEKIIARALCWPERKFVGALYGDTIRMKIAIECAGYTRDFNGQSTSNSEGLGGFEGARMLKIRTSSGAWLMPYIDLGYKVWDDGEFFRLSLDRGKATHTTSGSYKGTIPYYAPEPEQVAA